MNFQVAPNSPELSLLKYLPLTYHHSNFLAATLDSIAFLRAALIFTAWLFWIRYYLCGKFHAFMKKCTISLIFGAMPLYYDNFSLLSSDVSVSALLWQYQTCIGKAVNVQYKLIL